MTFALLSICTPHLDALGRLSTPSKRAYCERHGYAFLLASELLDPDRPASWSKVLLALRHLDDFDWLFWTDADSLVMNPDVRLEGLVAGAGDADLVITRDQWGVSMGEFLIRNHSERGRAFLEAVYRQEQFLHNRLWEQAAANLVIDRRLAPVVVHELPKRALNADVEDYRDGDFILHFPGQEARWFMMQQALGRIPRAGDAAGAAGATPPPASRERPRTASAASPRERAAARAELLEAMRLHQSGDSPAAEALCRRVLDRRPDDANAVHLLGLIHLQTGRFDAAFELVWRSVELDPSVADFHFNLGGMLARFRRHADAAVAFERAIALRPEHAPSHVGLGAALVKANRPRDAVRPLRRALQLDPANAEANFQAGLTARNVGRIALAAELFEDAIRAKPDHADAHRQRALALVELGRVEEAVDAFDRALELTPDDVHALHALHARSAKLLAMQYRTCYGPAERFEAHLDWARRHGRVDHDVRPDPGPLAGRRLRVGYVSPDFRRHPVGTFVLPLLAHHDRAAVEVFCYSDVGRPDDVTRRAEAAAEHWRRISTILDEQVADLIARDRIDVLVDLAGHTAGHRLRVFALHPAPVQVTYLGYPGTTGLAAMDFRLTDALADPPGVTDAFHTERLLRLPGCAWCYGPPDDFGPVSPLPALANGHVTFGSFNRVQKVAPETIANWAAALHAVPGSRLLSIAGEPDSGGASNARGGAVAAWLRGALDAHGVSPERVDVAGRLPRPDFVRAFDRVDVMLDTFPYHGTTTTCDALWMGIPVVTLSGDHAAARAGVSLLTAVGSPDWIARSTDQYARVAASLTSDLLALSATRARLRERVRRSPLGDAVRLAREVEQALLHACGASPG